jgi:hypothetical protein
MRLCIDSLRLKLPPQSPSVLCYISVTDANVQVQRRCIPQGICLQCNQKSLCRNVKHKGDYRFLSTSSGGERRCSPVVLLTASNPRHTTVDTDDASSRSGFPDSDPLEPGMSLGLCREWSPDQPASTSLSRWDESDGADRDKGTGREAEGDSLRVSAACA